MRKNHLTVFAAALAMAALVTAPAFAYGSCGSCDSDKMAKKGDKQNIVETAQAAGQFNTLLAAATAAGLADTLSNGGPFTVLAPTDEAFAALPEGTVESLLEPDNIDQLKAVLLYHVIDGSVMAETVVTLNSADTLQGSPIAITIEGDKVMVNDAQVVKTDIAASNGVIHVIDKVLLPPAKSASAAN